MKGFILGNINLLKAYYNLKCDIERGELDNVSQMGFLELLDYFDSSLGS